ncbi:MAG TPA: MATE family efflux transporter [Baekduia sp.]|uniref:MATE family efflux transporter n=1 Tax=Baekduia sp. TaxID=2600305 RepID=UPI002D77DF25|nr:MATE family efflux transporter [Baekduia sp.]HET6508659.1 MATE family efflux transporter [Baekduia sp.]
MPSGSEPSRGRGVDREILRLAVPALGALAAEPLYLLADTAIVGHLGTRRLAALALAASILSAVVTLCNFLTYGTTAQVARLHGAGQDRRAGEIAAQSLWLAVGIGVAATALVVALADPLMALVGGSGATADLAARYLRLSALGLPAALIALAGQGYLRGVGDLRSPLVVVVAANALNIVLELLFVYALRWGLDGSALGTVVAQAAMGAAFTIMLLKAPATSRRPHAAQLRSLAHMGGHIVVRTGSLLLAFLVAGAVLARESDDALGAHQIAFQVFIFLALVLDAIAIAGQVLVGRLLGAGDAPRAIHAANRMCRWSVVGGLVMAAALLATTHVLPNAFTDDDQVLHEAATLWPLFALMLPVGALVFALDGILLGAGDTRYLAYAMAFSAIGVFLPIALLTARFDWGVTGVWAGIDALMVARLATIGARYRNRRWVVTGATALAAR